MNFHLRPLCLAGLVLAGVTACAQQPPVQAMPPGPPAPGLAMPPPPPVADAAAPATVTGRIQRWLLNPNGEADGLLLSDGTQVGFPPHLSAPVLQALKAGDNVQVSGWRAQTVPVIRATTLTATASGRVVTDQPPERGMAPPREPGSLTEMSVTGRVERVLYTGRGDVNGALLASGEIVRFPPQPAAAVPAALKAGAALSARGWGTRNALGSAMEATALGSSPDTLQALFAGPGREPRGARGRPGRMPPPDAMQPPPPPGAVVPPPAS